MRRTVVIPLLPVVAVAIGLAATTASALTHLVAGRSLLAKDVDNEKSDKIKFKYVRDPGIVALQNPLCPTQSKIRLYDSNEVHPEIALDCNNWSVAGSGYRYKATPSGSGSLLKITYRAGGLAVQIKGPPYSSDTVTGSITFLETRVTIGASEYCGRWEAPPSLFRKNTPTTVSARGPTAACQLECGNTIVEAPEQCDDGNATNGDGCDVNCTVTACGNGIQTAGEDCDDGNLSNGDGCRPNCTVEACGDGITDPAEDCDDGNVADGDCCDASCDFDANGVACTDDLNECTDDTCNGAGVCIYTNNTADCDDMNGCTVNDSCSAGVCGGELRSPWINEFDYDDVTGDLFNDRDEFIEIAGPAGLDLSNYRVVVVEGAGPGCTTGGQPAGSAYLNAPIPNGTVLPDTTGTGIGLLVVCFTSTSTSVGANCDVTLAGTQTDSNLRNGNLTNADLYSCPDGIALLDPSNSFVDGVTYEGIVANTGAFGPFFHPPYTDPSYVAERDEGWLVRVAIEKTSDTLERATSSSEWRDPTENALCVGQGGGLLGFLCATNTATPGVENPTQNMECGSPCEAFLDAPVELTD
jgi:cysteine-rich repeat protein